ncbi:unnamed protein product [Caenorhabditis bovis]|uniref:Uncharacterized protein n=1 Tax=Caenorhabditis bovis TaxID=2654633 RepID=A0A8S1EEX1_9PELO|nr:unnamed protein product [Caenorhabditis bovis]
METKWHPLLAQPQYSPLLRIVFIFNVAHSMFLREVYLIFDSIPFENNQIAEVFAKLGEYEWASCGKFRKGELAGGVNMSVIVSSQWLSSPELELRVIFDGDSRFESVLSLICQDDKIYAGGVAEIYEERNPQNRRKFGCAVLVEKFENRIHPNDPTTSNAVETQTSERNNAPKTINQNTQYTPRAVANSSDNTEGILLTFNQIVANVDNLLAKRFDKIRADMRPREAQTKKAEEEVVEDPKPSGFNTYNVIPRMTKLSLLDQMIVEKMKVLAILEHNSTVYSQMKRLKEDERIIERLYADIAKSPKLLEHSTSSSSSSRSSPSSATSSHQPTSSTDAAISEFQDLKEVVETFQQRREEIMKEWNESRMKIK